MIRRFFAELNRTGDWHTKKKTETLKTNDEVKFLDYLHEHHFQSMFIATLSLLFLVTLNIYILVVKTILTFYWLVLLNFCVFMCQGSWSLVTSRVFINDDSEEYEASVIEVWVDFNSPFFKIYLTLPLESEGSIPPCYLPCHSLGLCSFLEMDTIIIK